MEPSISLTEAARHQEDPFCDQCLQVHDWLNQSEMSLCTKKHQLQQYCHKSTSCSKGSVCMYYLLHGKQYHTSLHVMMIIFYYFSGSKELKDQLFSSANLRLWESGVEYITAAERVET